MLYTLMTPETGRVLVDGVDVAADPEQVRRSLACVARRAWRVQAPARENIDYFGQLHGMGAQEIAARTARLAAALQMEDFLDRATEGFFAGSAHQDRYRPRAGARPEKNVILDEPTNGLDVMTTRGLRGLKELRAEGRCVIFSSHIMQEVAALCDRIVIIAQGRVVAQGTPDELRAATGESNRKTHSSN